MKTIKEKSSSDKLNSMKKKWSKYISKFVKEPGVMSEQILPIVLNNEEEYIKSHRNFGMCATNTISITKTTEKKIYTLICDVFSRLKMPKLVAVQPMETPACLSMFLQKKQEREDDSALPRVVVSIEKIAVSAKQIRLNTLCWFVRREDLEEDGLGIQFEATKKERDAIFYEESVKSLASEIDHYILLELLDGVLKNSTLVESVEKYITNGEIFNFEDAANKLHRKCFAKPTWALGSPEFVEKMLGKKIQLEEGVFLAGNVFGINVWCDAFFGHALLIGSNGNNCIDTGCIWSPFIPMSFMPNVLDPKAPPNEVYPRNYIRHAVSVVNPDRFMLLTDKRTAEGIATEKICMSSIMPNSV